MFVETKRQADYISVYLAEKGLPATSIHGDREQRQREEAIGDFKHGRMQILVATAVASRGLGKRFESWQPGYHLGTMESFLPGS